MGNVIISTNMTLDGVVQDPDGKEGFRLGGWFHRYGSKDLDAWTAHELDEARGTAALLLGRRSDKWFAQRWLSRDGELADRLNNLPKYVISATLDRPHWSNATVLGGDAVSEVSKLKQRVDGEIVVYASHQLGRALLERDLVDEVRMVVFPVLLGDGERLFDQTGVPKAMRLVETRPLGDGLAFLTYRPVRDA